MASGRLLIPSWMPALDSDGDPISGVKAYFYVNLTTTLAPIYSNEDLTTPITNPVEANSSGRFPAIWADGDVLYSVAIEAPYGPAGVPFSYDNLSVSLGADIATAEAAEAAADDANAALAAVIAAIEAATEAGGGSAAVAGALAGQAAGTAAANVVVAGKANTDFSNLAAPAQSILDAKATRTLSNLQPVNQLLGGTLIDFSPIGNGSGTKGHFNLLFDDTNESVSVRQFDFALGANYSKGTPGSGPTDEGAKVLMYGGVNMSAGCYKAWTQNLLMHINPGVTPEFVNVVEFDIDNYSGVDYGSGIGSAGLSGNTVWAVTINGANPGANTVTGGMAIISSSAGPLVERGYVVGPNAARQAAFDDYSSATASYRDLGSHSYGLDLSGTYSALGVRVPNAVGYGAKRNNNTNATLMTLNVSNNMQLATSGVTDTFIGTSFYPNQDNSKALGGTTFRWVKGFLGQLSLTTLGIYADNAAAVTAGLAVGDVYRTSTGQLMVRY